MLGQLLPLDAILGRRPRTAAPWKAQKHELSLQEQVSLASSPELGKDWKENHSTIPSHKAETGQKVPAMIFQCDFRNIVTFL